MSLSIFIKDGAEVSATKNWIKEQLETCELFFTDSIEGYTIDQTKGVILLMDRARVDYNEVKSLSDDEIISNIFLLDGEGSILRKIALAKIFNIEFRYLLYSESSEHHVWIYKFNNKGEGAFEREFSSFSEFGFWLNTQRTMVINKGYGHPLINSHKTSQFTDLPKFDQTLRKNKTPWLANIDGVLSDKSGRPIALLEYQKTSKSPNSHSNNFFFFSGEDVNRFKSIEIAKLHSGLPFFILVWSDNFPGFRIKQLDCCSYPDPEQDQQTLNLLRGYFPTNKSEDVYNSICSQMTTYSLMNSEKGIITNFHRPVLSLDRKTFPHIYYSYNKYFTNNDGFLNKFLCVLGICPICGARLVQRTGSYGPFVRCSSFPSCSFQSKY